MRTASISELKANLSRYLREVRRGGEIQVFTAAHPWRGSCRPRRVTTTPGSD